MMNIFERKCETCSEMVWGPRVGGKARGKWLGYNLCEKCRKADAEHKEPTP